MVDTRKLWRHCKAERKTGEACRGMRDMLPLTDKVVCVSALYHYNMIFITVRVGIVWCTYADVELAGSAAMSPVQPKVSFRLTRSHVHYVHIFEGASVCMALVQAQPRNVCTFASTS